MGKEEIMNANGYPVSCVHHPRERATHNCLNCGKPLCMTCVSARGYYCSDTCKAAVQAAEPNVAQDTSLDRLDAQLHRVRQTLANILPKLIPLVVLLLIGGAGWTAYRLFFAPRGPVILNSSVDSAVASFFVHPLDADSILIRANNQLYRFRPHTQRKDWTVTLPDEESGSIITVQGSQIQIHSVDHVRWLDAHTGALQREAQAPPQACAVWNQHVLSIHSTALAATDSTNDKANQTADNPGTILVHQLLRFMQEVIPSPTPREYLVRFEGDSVMETKLPFTEFPRVFTFPTCLVLAGGRHLAVFDQVGEPRWQTTFEEPIITLACYADHLAVATETNVMLMELATGTARGRVTGLQAESLAVAPDGSVYASVLLTPDEVKAHEKQYRAARVAPLRLTRSGEAKPALLKLDARAGTIVWGVLNIGNHVLITDDALFVADATERVDLLAPSGLTQCYYSIRQLDPRTGADLWYIVDKGILVDAHLLGNNPLLVVLPNPPSGGKNPVGTYRLQLVKAR